MKKSFMIILTSLIAVLMMGCGSSSTQGAVNDSLQVEETEENDGYDTSDENDKNDTSDENDKNDTSDENDKYDNSVESDEYENFDELDNSEEIARLQGLLEELTFQTESNNLTLALDYMLVYGMNFPMLEGNPGDDFWNEFVAAIMFNSWFGVYETKEGENCSNEYVENIAYNVTAVNLECNTFPDGIIAEYASPYLFSTRKENVKVEEVSSRGIYSVTFDWYYKTSSVEEVEGIKKVETMICRNEDSKLDGFSIQMLQVTDVSSPALE